MLLAALDRSAEVPGVGVLCLVPEGVRTAQPLFAPGGRGASTVLMPVCRLRQSKEHEVCALLCQKVARRAIGGSVGVFVVNRNTCGLPETIKDFRERLAQLACFVVE